MRLELQSAFANPATMSNSHRARLSGPGPQGRAGGPCPPGATMNQMAAEIALNLDAYHNKATLHSIDVVNDFVASQLMLCQEL